MVERRDSDSPGYRRMQVAVITVSDQIRSMA